MHEIKVDKEFKSLIPPLSKDEYSQLESNIRNDGCRDPLVVWKNGKILIDGHNRHEICLKHNVEYEVFEMDFDSKDEAKLWIVYNQMGRRNLQPFQRIELALIAEPILERQAKENQRRAGGAVPQKSVKAVDTQKELAKLANVSHDTVHKVVSIKAKASEEVKQQLRDGLLSINQAFQDIKREEIRTERVEKIKEISKGNIELKTDKKYPVILCDPPWEYEHSVSSNRDIENHYPTMKLKDITDLPVEELACGSSVLFMWATSPKLQEAIHVMSMWGFEYRTCMVWVKDKIGMGYYARQRHELILIGSKGDMPCPEPKNRPDSVIESPRGKHSSKPEVVYDLIEKMYPEFEKIELFSRSPRKNWNAWGNQS